MDKPTRNLIQSATQDARRLLEQEFREQLQGTFDIIPDTGAIAPKPGAHLDARQRFIRSRIVAAVRHERAKSASDAEAVHGCLREAAFTTLNRFAALKLMEARHIVQECVSRGEQSAGFREFAGLAPGLATLPDHGYRLYLECLFDEIGTELGVLFDRRDPASLLWPRRSALLNLLDILNRAELAAANVWAEDETIGWIYQYFNSKEEREAMRDPKQGGSAAPRNSRELAVRNQFFTPRYVVQFLADNTLGRIWYEMTKGQTRLKDRCRYLVRRPNEIFLKPGESAPAPTSPNAGNASPSPGGGDRGKGDSTSRSREDLLNQHVFIPHRPLKDPREIRMLDPACGSMHFGLYAFDLYEIIYAEAWDIARSGCVPVGADPSFTPYCSLIAGNHLSKEAYLRDVPSLIIEHNIHGIDIDRRAVQIAGLSLWLRAQRAWQDQSVKPAERPPIRKSNVVCAEPMPGEPELLRDFVEREFPAAERPVFAHLLTQVFDEMKLAGEAGSLLKIEEEIGSAIAEARKQWTDRRRAPEFFNSRELAQLDRRAGSQTELPITHHPLRVTDLQGITDEEFWERVEKEIYEALQKYAQHADNGAGFQRRLFAEDAVRGFGFIDVYRKRYDALLMNPPFGEFPKRWRKEAQRTYPNSSCDILAAFVDASVQTLSPQGLLGAITSRTCFFLLSFRPWRETVVLKAARAKLLLDLGQGIMDGAMVEAAAFVLEKAHTASALFCSRLLDDDDKATTLTKILRAVQEGKPSERTFFVDPLEFRKVPGAPFCYWVGSSVRQLFEQLPPFDSGGREAKQGLATGEDFRFARLWWEVLPNNLVSLPKGATQEDYRTATKGRTTWCPFAKGGALSPFHQDLCLVVRWTDDGYEIRNFSDLGTGYIYSRYRGAERYFLPGITYADRTTTRFAPRILPEGTIISVKGSGIYCESLDECWAALAILNSATFGNLMDLLVGGANLAKSYQVNTVGRVPWPRLSKEASQQLRSLGRAGWRLRTGLDRGDVTSHYFVLPWNARCSRQKLAACEHERGQQVMETKRSLATVQCGIDRISAGAYGLGGDEFKANEANLHSGEHSASEEDDEEGGFPGEELLGRLLTAYCVGAAFGRWDIRYATGEKAAPELPDPFAPLPVCPPGMLQDAQGLPARPGDLPDDYPLRITWSGILVDDLNHLEDIERRIREAIEVIWPDYPTSIESEACEILGVKSLRDYSRKSFFAYHLCRYSRSRRQAPIYWPLSTPSVSYTIWLYYHRFNKDTFYRLQEIATEKLAYEDRKLTALHQGFNSEPSAGQRKQLADQESFVQELRAFREEIARVAPLWNPDLNDGVIINSAPLWRLIAHRAWQKDVKACWDSLVAAQYDWSHLAMHLWPERVVPKCPTDRSLAIAHGLDKIFWEEDEAGRARPRKVTNAEIQKLIADRTSPAVKEALQSLLTAPVAGGGNKRSRK
jgi:hypothetical protein